LRLSEEATKFEKNIPHPLTSCVSRTNFEFLRSILNLCFLKDDLDTYQTIKNWILRKNKSFIKGALTQKRALKQLEGALKFKTQSQLKNYNNRNSTFGSTILLGA
jgi:hypothetical protein